MKEFKEVTFLAILLSTCLLAQATNQLGDKFRQYNNGSVVSPTPKGTTSVTSITPKGTTSPTSATSKGTTSPTSATSKGTTSPTSATSKGTTSPTSATSKGTTLVTSTTTKGSTQKPTTPTKPPSSTTTKVSTSTTSSTTAKPTPPHCLPGQKRPVEGSCKNYTECDKSFNWVQKTCTNWCHNFNPKSLKCDWSWKYQCADPTSTPCTAPTSSATAPASPNETTVSPGGSTIAPSSTSPPSTKITTSATTTQAPAECPNGQTKVYQSGDCKDYLQCDSGKWAKKSCSWGFDFDINKLECRWSWWAKC